MGTGSGDEYKLEHLPGRDRRSDKNQQAEKASVSTQAAHNGLCVEPSLPGAEEIAPCRLFSGIPEHSTNGLWPCLLVNFLCPKVSGSRLIWARALGNREKKISGYEANFFPKAILETSKSALSVGCCVSGTVCAGRVGWKSSLPVGLCVVGLEYTDRHRSE